MITNLTNSVLLSTTKLHFSKSRIKQAFGKAHVPKSELNELIELNKRGQA